MIKKIYPIRVKPIGYIVWITVCGLTDGEFALAGLRFERGHVARCFLLGFLLLPLGELRLVLAGVLADEQIVALVAETDVIGE